MNRSPAVKIFTIFLLWRIGLFIVAYLAILFIPQFGNRFPYWDQILEPTGLPQWIWGFGNFDGVHYLRIATMGYESSQYSQAFFPLYPKLIEVLSPVNMEFITGLILSNIFFVLTLFAIYYLFRIDSSHTKSLKSVIFLLAVPTSFYLGAVYAESLLIFLSVLSLIFIRKKEYIKAGFFIALASATKIFGLVLILPLIVEIIFSFKKGEIKIFSEEFIKALFGLMIAPIGIIAYMVYLKLYFDNPLYFFNSQPLFGAQRGTDFVLLPQVMFRYLKIFITTPIFSLPFFNSVLEFFAMIISLIIAILAYKKIRLSYWIFILGCLIIPTLTGTLSSMPRYILMNFLLIPFIVERAGKFFNYVLFLLFILQFILLSLFVRGYWVA